MKTFIRKKVKFTKNKMGTPSGFRAIDGLPRALWDETEFSYSIPFPLRSHSIRFIGHAT